MLDLLLLVAAVSYGASGALLLGHLASNTTNTRRLSWGRAALALGAVAHLVHDGLRWAWGGGGPFTGIGVALSTLGLLAVVGYFAVGRSRPRLDVVGAFVAPVTLVLLGASRLSSTRGGQPVGGAMLAVHVGSVLLGTAAFTLAFAMSIAYLLQERQVKQKKLRGVFQRLPSLDVLDEVGHGCLVVGMPVLTLGIVTGLLVAARAAAPGQRILEAWQQFFGVGVWAFFAALLGLRLIAGWRGRRAAIGTIVGYASALVVLVGYFLRAAP